MPKIFLIKECIPEADRLMSRAAGRSSGIALDPSVYCNAWCQFTNAKPK